MKTSNVRRYKWFWAWQDEREEAWLSDMASQGYHLARLPFPGVYDFTQGDQTETVYRLDFPYVAGQEYESYLQLFEDAGWEHVGKMGGWQYFRRSVEPGETAEIFSDLDSKIKKYQRLLTYLVIFLPIWAVVLPDNLDRYSRVLGITVTVLFTAFTLLYAFAMIMIFRRIQQLNEQKE